MTLSRGGRYTWRIKVEELPEAKNNYFGWGVCDPKQIADILNGTGYGHYMYSNGYSNLYFDMKQSGQAQPGSVIEMVFDLSGEEFDQEGAGLAGNLEIKVDGESVGLNQLKEEQLVPFIMVKWSGTCLTTKIIK